MRGNDQWIGLLASEEVPASYLVDITCTEFDRFDLCEDADYAIGQALLTASKDTVTVKKFKAMEKSLGQVHNDKSVFAADKKDMHPIQRD